jgi:hypothetical protein
LFTACAYVGGAVFFSPEATIKQAIMKRWVKALRSGKYRQTREQLRAADAEGQPTDGFCCLGVLCDLFAKDHPDAKWLSKPEAEAALKGHIIGCAFSTAVKKLDDVAMRAGVLPDPVLRWAGMKENSGKFTLPDSVRERDLGADIAWGAERLSELNDAAEWNFKQIAAFIEKHWRKL